MANSDELGSTAETNSEKPRSIGIQSVEIGLALLDVFTRSNSALALKQVSDASGMAPSKVHRYLVSFVRSGMLVQMGPNSLYDLGPTARRLGMAAMNRADAFAIASKHIAQLRDDTGHTVSLTVWGDAGPVLVRWDSGSFPLLVNLRVGSSIPLVGSAIGHLFLCHLPEKVTKPVLERQRRMSSYEHLGAPPSGKVLATLRTSPSLHLSSALIAGVEAFAAPTFDAQPELSSVICLLASREVVKDQGADGIVEQVEDCAKAISEELGYRNLVSQEP